jgi:MscS family membrane protein
MGCLGIRHLRRGWYRGHAAAVLGYPPRAMHAPRAPVAAALLLLVTTAVAVEPAAPPASEPAVQEPAAAAAAVISAAPAEAVGAAPAAKVARARRVVVEEDERSFLEEHLPPALLRHGPRGLRWWQWLALPVAALLAIALGWLAGLLSRRILGHMAARTQAGWDDLLVMRLGPPVTLFWALVVAAALRPALELDGAFDVALGRGLKAGFFLAAFWGAFRAIDVGFRALAEAPAARVGAGLRGLVPLLRKSAKVAAFGLGLVAVLTELGFQVTSLLAGLGIGGLAVALAAQKTVENLIGSVAIGVDQPFRVGDFITVDGATGTVESMGMRSTRIRTLDRTLVTLPNGRLADMRVESFAARDRFRLAVTLELVYSTSADQMRQVLRGVEAALRAHPAHGPEAPVVRFADLGDSGLKVEVMGWLQAGSFDEFAALRGELYLRFMEVVEQAGTSFAFPTQTLHVASLPEPARRPPGGAAGA